MIFENFSTDDSLSENGVRVIYQDKNNNIWFGHTGGGISRYNGKIFESLNHDSILIEGDITAILEDEFSQIWIGSHGSGAFLIKNPNSGMQDLNISNYKGQQKLSDRVFSIIKTQKDKLLFIIDGGIKLFDSNQETFNFYSPEGLPKYFQLTAIFEDKNEILWLGSYNGGLYKYNPKSGKVKIFDKKLGLAHNFISTINNDYKGRIWVEVKNGKIEKLKQCLILALTAKKKLFDR